MPERAVCARQAPFAAVESFCDRIERFTAAAVEKDRSAFWYRGSNLRYAVERTLYQLLDDTSIPSDRELRSPQRRFEPAVVRHRLRTEYLRLTRSFHSSFAVANG